MLGALHAAARQVTESGADVLLLTDGEIWQAEEVIAAARASG